MNPQLISIDQFDYPLPDDRIAAHPLAERDRCRLLVRHASGTLADHRFYEIPSLLPAGAMLVCNNTRVIHARLRFRKDGGGALIEIFCLEPVAPADYALNFAATDSVEWLCFVGNSKRWKDAPLHGQIEIDGTPVTITATRTGRHDNTSTVRLSWTGGHTFARVIEAAGELPIPPYLNRATEQTDEQDYQTVFSRVDGSVAAPTAGLHFTPGLLAELERAGVARRELTLHVGAGTFQPVKADCIGDHLMHSEFISVERSLIEELARHERPVVAVGTTSVRTLESIYHLGCRAAMGLDISELPQWYPYDPAHPRLSVADALQALLGRIGSRLVASTRVIIAPGYRYMMVDAMVTNFHQPRSTLLLLVSAFMGGGDLWRPLYEHALDNPDYRFLSYGDACLLISERCQPQRQQASPAPSARW